MVAARNFSFSRGLIKKLLIPYILSFIHFTTVSVPLHSLGWTRSRYFISLYCFFRYIPPPHTHTPCCFIDIQFPSSPLLSGVEESVILLVFSARKNKFVENFIGKHFIGNSHERSISLVGNESIMDGW